MAVTFVDEPIYYNQHYLWVFIGVPGISKKRVKILGFTAVMAVYCICYQQASLPYVYRSGKREKHEKW